MGFSNWFLETFSTPRRVRERRVELYAHRMSQAVQWAACYFPSDMRRASTAVALALCEIECTDTTAFDPNSRLIEDLEMTDLEPVQLAQRLEKEFDIHIPDPDAERLATVSEWVHYVHERASACA